MVSTVQQTQVTATPATAEDVRETFAQATPQVLAMEERPEDICKYLETQISDIYAIRHGKLLLGIVGLRPIQGLTIVLYGIPTKHVRSGHARGIMAEITRLMDEFGSRGFIKTVSRIRMDREKELKFTEAMGFRRHYAADGYWLLVRP